MFKKHCCTWEVAFQQPLTTLPLLCMPVKPGHRPSEVSAAFIWSLSFDRVLVAVWSLLEARKHCVVCQAVADVKWCVGFFLFCFLYAWQVLTALQTNIWPNTVHQCTTRILLVLFISSFHSLLWGYGQKSTIWKYALSHYVSYSLINHNFYCICLYCAGTWTLRGKHIN